MFRPKNDCKWLLKFTNMGVTSSTLIATKLILNHARQVTSTCLDRTLWDSMVGGGKSPVESRNAGGLTDSSRLHKMWDVKTAPKLRKIEIWEIARKTITKSSSKINFQRKVRWFPSFSHYNTGWSSPDFMVFLPASASSVPDHIDLHAPPHGLATWTPQPGTVGF